MKKYKIEEFTPDLRYPEIKKIRIDHEKGVSASFLNYGATVSSLKVPDRNGRKENIVLSYNTIKEYLDDQAYLGCIVGRYANRIANGQFFLNDRAYQLSCNQGQNHLHGGFEGFNKKVWTLDTVVESAEKVSITYSYVSPDGEEGYPGKLEAKVTYVVTVDSLEICYQALSDQDTLFNPTNHTYFNLSGHKSLIDNHLLKIDASRALSVNSELIPDGNFISIKETEYDFSFEREIGRNEYDVCYEIHGSAVLKHQTSGRVVEIITSFPGIQLYTGDNLNGKVHKSRAGVCLETQYFPDSPHHDHFPDASLNKGQEFFQKTKYLFSVLPG